MSTVSYFSFAATIAVCFAVRAPDLTQYKMERGKGARGMNRIGKKEGEGRWYYRCYRPWAGIGVAARAVGSQRDELPSERLSAWLSDRLPQQQRKENEGVPGYGEAAMCVTKPRP